MVMTTNEAVGLLLAGTIETIVGGTILYGITRKNLHSWLRVWWLPKDSEYSDAIGRIMGVIVGGGFLLMCVVLLIGSISALLK